ncbi:MAG: hypothetical protein WC047_07030 [Kiritimatiellales bacterium]
MRFLPASIITALLLTSAAGAFSPEETVLYRNQELGFELSYPQSWVVNQLVNGPAFALRNTDNSVMGTISVSVINLGDGAQKFFRQMTEDAGRSKLESVKARFGEARLVEAKETTLSGEPACFTRLDYRIKNLDLDRWIANIQLIAAHDGLAYIINFESPVETLDVNYQTFRAIVYTFNFRARM